jgi:hypothetical protein
MLYKYKVGHAGIEGNEKADVMAKTGASTPPCAPKLFICISWSNVITELLDKAKADTLGKLKTSNLKEVKRPPKPLSKVTWSTFAYTD